LNQYTQQAMMDAHEDTGGVGVSRVLVDQQEQKEKGTGKEEPEVVENDPVILFNPLTIGAMLFLPPLDSNNTSNVTNVSNQDTLLPSPPKPYRIDKLVRVEVRDLSSAWLVFYNDDDALLTRMSHTHNQQQQQQQQQQRSSRSRNDGYRLVLDLLTTVSREREEVDETTHSPSLLVYRYRRLGLQLRFEIAPLTGSTVSTSTTTTTTVMTISPLAELLAMDFVLGQFAMKVDVVPLRVSESGTGTGRNREEGGTETETEQDRGANIVARGLEESGVAVRHLLRVGGRCTGDAIRFLGRHYTQLVANNDITTRNSTSNSNEDNNDEIVAEAAAETKDFWTVTRSRSFCDEPSPKSKSPVSPLPSQPSQQQQRQCRVVSSRDVERAAARRRWAEGVHCGARTVTSAALFPVRWTGRQATRMHERDVSQSHLRYQDDERDLMQQQQLQQLQEQQDIHWHHYQYLQQQQRQQQQVSVVQAVSAKSRRVVWDTMGGLGNGLLSVCKGFTEAMAEVQLSTLA
jgi:hypothetical protein